MLTTLHVQTDPMMIMTFPLFRPCCMDDESGDATTQAIEHM
jgi:hypothetical protein